MQKRAFLSHVGWQACCINQYMAGLFKGQAAEGPGPTPPTNRGPPPNLRILFLVQFDTYKGKGKGIAACSC